MDGIHFCMRKSLFQNTSAVICSSSSMIGNYSWDHHCKSQTNNWACSLLLIPVSQINLAIRLCCMLIHKFSAAWFNHSSIQSGIVFARNRSTSDMQTLHCRVKQFVSIICWLHLVYKYFRLGFNITKSLFQKVTSVKSQLISRQCYLLFERRPQKRSSLISFCCGKGLLRKQPHCSCCGKSLLAFFKFKIDNFSWQDVKSAMDEAGQYTWTDKWW